MSELKLTQSHLEEMKAVLVEPNAGIRADLQEGLRSLGFANITATGNMKGARDAFIEGDVRLLVGETNLPEGDLSELILQVRHQEIGDSPFVVAVALISELERAKAAIENGADDVLLRPFIQEKFLERIHLLTGNRKDFVVTTEYIGPDRSAKRRLDGMKIPCIFVPNPLLPSFSGRAGAKALRRASTRALSQINLQKVERHAYQTRWLVERIAPRLGKADRTDGGDFDEHLDRLYWVAQDLNRRVSHTSYAYAAYLIQTLILMIDEIRELPDLSGEKEANLLDKLSRSILRACTPDQVDLPLEEQPEATDDTHEAEEEPPSAAVA